MNIDRFWRCSTKGEGYINTVKNAAAKVIASAMWHAPAVYAALVAFVFLIFALSIDWLLITRSSVAA